MQEVVGHITEGVCRPLKVSETNGYEDFSANKCSDFSCSAHVLFFAGSNRAGHRG